MSQERDVLLVSTLLQIPVQKRKKEKKKEQNSLVICSEGKLPLWCVVFVFFFYGVRMQTPTTGV